MISTKTVMDAWKKALAYVYRNGKDFTDENMRNCREVFNLVITVDNPEKELTSPVQRLNSFEDWVYPSLDEITHVILSDKLVPDYAYSYGPRIFNFQGKIDQINSFIIPVLRQNPSSRRAVVTLFDPVNDSNITSRDTPSLMLMDFKIREGKLHMIATLRSSDIFFGWPANIYQLHVLQKHIAEKLNVETGSLTTFSVSAHIFDNQFEFIEKIIKE